MLPTATRRNPPGKKPIPWPREFPPRRTMTSSSRAPSPSTARAASSTSSGATSATCRCFMENIESVTIVDRRRSHWGVKGPGEYHGRMGFRHHRRRSRRSHRLDVGGGLERPQQRAHRIPRFAATAAARSSRRRSPTTRPPARSASSIAKLFQREPKIQARQRSAALQATHGDRRNPDLRTPVAAPRAN